MFVQSATGPVPRSSRLPWHTIWFLLAFYAVAAVCGFRSSYYWHPSVLDWLINWTLCICLAIWAVIDARTMRHPIPVSAQQWFVFFAAILVPVYAIRTRRWRGVGYILLHAFLWYVLVFVVSNVTYLIISGS